MGIPIVCLGAGQHAGMVAEMLENYPEYSLLGFLDRDSALHGKSIEGIKVLGGDSFLPSLKAQGVSHFIMGIGATKSCVIRASVYNSAISEGFRAVTLIHPTAIVSKKAVIEAGCVIMPGAIINRHARLGVNVIVNSGAVIEHDCVIGANSHVATTACLAGSVIVGEEVLIGANAVVREQIKISNRAIIGAGAVVVCDVEVGKVVVGNPASELSTASKEKAIAHE